MLALNRVHTVDWQSGVSLFLSELIGGRSKEAWDRISVQCCCPDQWEPTHRRQYGRVLVKNKEQNKTLQFETCTEGSTEWHGWFQSCHDRPATPTSSVQPPSSVFASPDSNPLFPLSLCPIVFSSMQSSLVLFPGLLPLFRPCLSLTRPRRPCPGNLNSPLSRTLCLLAPCLTPVCLDSLPGELESLTLLASSGRGLFLCTYCGFYDPVWTINCWTVPTPQPVLFLGPSSLPLQKSLYATWINQLFIN